MLRKTFLLTLFLALFAIFFLNASPHKGPERKTYDSIDLFAKEFAKKNYLKILGPCSSGEGKRSLWGISLVSGQNLTFDQGRQLAKELSFQLLYKIFHDPVFADYCKVRAEKYSTWPAWVGRDAASPKIIREYVAFRLAFWDKEVNRPLFPYLAQIKLEDGFLYFYYANPVDQSLQEPIVESLDSLNLPNYNNSP